MAILSGNLAGGPSQTNIQPEQAVQEVNVFAQATNALVNTASAYSQYNQKRNEAIQIDAQNQVTKSFIGELTSVAEQVRQGKKTSLEGERLSSNLLNKYTAASNGRMGKELIDIHNKFTSSTMGEVLKEGSEQEQRLQEEKDEAFEEGYFFSNSSEEAIQKGLALYRQDTVASRLRQERIEKNNATISDINTLKAVNEQEANDHLKMIAPNELEKTSIFADNILARRAAGEDQAVLLNEIRAKERQIIGMLGMEAPDSTKRVMDLLSQPIIEQLTELKGVVDGSIQADQLEKNKKLRLAEMEAMILADPSNAATAAFVNVMGPNSLQYLQPQILKSHIDFLEKVTSGKPDPDKMFGENSKDVAEGLEGVLRAAVDNQSTPSQKEGGINSFNSVLKSFNASEGFVEKPEQFKDILTVVSSDRFLEASKLGQIDRDASDKAVEVFRTQFANKVLPKINTAFFDLAESGATTTYREPSGARQSLPNPNEFLEPTIIDGTVRFKIKEGMGQSTQRDFISAPLGTKDGSLGIPREVLVLKRDRANQVLGKLLTTLVRSHAHIEGHNDYNQIFDSVYAGVLQQDVQEPVQPVEASLPEIGTVDSGYEFIGGDPSSPDSWRKVGE